MGGLMHGPYLDRSAMGPFTEDSAARLVDLSNTVWLRVSLDQVTEGASELSERNSVNFALCQISTDVASNGRCKHGSKYLSSFLSLS